MKYCRKCKKHRPITNFWKRKDRNGFYAWCIECCKEQGRNKIYPKKEFRGYGQFHSPKIDENKKLAS